LTDFGSSSGLVSLVDLLDQRAAENPDGKAFGFVPERGNAHLHLTYGELHRRAHALAARLARHAVKGDRALLLFPPGLDFIVAFFGCLTAGMIAVPLMVPRRTAARDSSAAVIADCAPTVAMTSHELLEVRGDVADRFRDSGFDWMTVDAMAEAPAVVAAVTPVVGRDDIAYLQYTSGSTSVPKGVVVTHGNLLANFEMIRLGMSNTRHSCSVGWVPVYHDMGLMMGVMQPLYLGAMSVLMAPAAFMQRPLNWLRTIHQYRAELTSAPNFAFDLCVSRFRADQMEGIDLSCWKVALNAAEPVHANTIARFTETFARYGFDPGTMYPGYGLAEATLLVSGGVRGEAPSSRAVSRASMLRGDVTEPKGTDDVQTLVACGRSMVGQQIAIVDADARSRVAACQLGEVWASGPHIAHGYWGNPAATVETFHARIVGSAEQNWLRTGDLGFLDEDGRLFITGRIKDLIIIRGANHYPQDIERTVQESHPALRRDCGAAFAILDQEGNEKLAVVQEIERTHRRDLDIDEVAGRIREAVTRQHEIAIETIALIPPATLPKTTSGKIQRSAARRLLLEGALEVLG
jgi:acyl-CoA synthetase (AMP-forming)/AMP-acid ligase II